MSKVLYIGVYRDGTGWGQAAIDYILALDAAGVDVVPRPLKLNDFNHEPPARVLELEKKSAQGCDVVIQHVLPHQCVYDGHFRKNICLYASETSNFKSSVWADRLNLMDEAWVINLQMQYAAVMSGVTVTTRVIPHATDVERFQRSYEPLDVLKPYRERGDFLFYFVGEMVRRKNLAALLKAFHLEFDPYEPVQLVIKTSLPGKGHEEARGHIRGFCDEIKRGLKLHYPKQELVFTERLTDHGMMRLHAGCDCFVLPSYGEAWAIPAFDAMALGKTPIVTACGGFLGYMSDASGWLVRSHFEPVFGALDSFDDLYTGHENWEAVDIGHLRRCMRNAFGSESLRKDKARHGTARAYDFSYDRVGQLMKEALAD